ncbi:MAG: CRISPR-associated endonuclease Cas1 [Anaerolineae bacterium]
MQLVIDQFGSFLGLKSERLQVRKGKEMVQEAPLADVDAVVLLGRGISLSTDVTLACAEHGIPLHVLTSTGKPMTSLISAGLTGTVKTRREQLLAFADGRGVTLAKAFARGKLQNQANLLKYMGKYRKGKDAALYQDIRDAAISIEGLADEIGRLSAETVDDLRPSLLNREGRAAQAYWDAVGKALRDDLDWPGRKHQGAQDTVNMALNYGYGILYAQVEHALLLAGLDPYGGFIHVDRPGKPSLVLDLIEEFRQPAVDRTVFGLLNKGVAIEVDEEGRLTLETRRTLAEKVLARQAGLERYEGKKHTLKAILACQAAHIATFVRGERPTYQPFVAGW